MPKFIYRAVDRSGQSVQSSVDAASIEAAADLLYSQGLFVLEIKAQSPAARQKVKTFVANVRKSGLFDVRSVSVRELSSFTRKLATLLDAGLPLLRCLHVLREQQNSLFMVNVLNNIQDEVSSGEPFSQALRRYPAVFNRLYVSMVQAGEAGGMLTVVLERLAEFYEQMALFRSKVKHAMIYPLVIVAVAVVVLLVLMLFVVPKFKMLFAELHVELPLATRMLIAGSSWVQAHILWILAVAVGLVLWAKAALRLSWVRLWRDRLWLRLPLWGSLMQKVEIVRFSRLLGTLLQSGVPILQAFDIARNAATNMVFERSIAVVQTRIREGEGVHQPLAQTKIFPMLLVHMVEVGEESGKLDDMLIKTADLYESDVRHMIETLTKMVEPLLIAGIAVMVGFIVIAMFLPLLSMMSALGR